MKFLLDTNICIYVINRKPRKLLHRLTTRQHEEVAVSMITVAELHYGVYRSDEGRRELNARALRTFLAPFTALSFTETDAERFGAFKAHLRRKGEGVADLDVAIGAQASTRGLILVTNYPRHFRRMPGLKVEHWA